jgi:hypothetical protein
LSELPGLIALRKMTPLHEQGVAARGVLVASLVEEVDLGVRDGGLVLAVVLDGEIHLAELALRG